MMLSVLIVDDTADVRSLVHVTLKLNDIAAHESDGGPAALAALRSGLRPDVVLLDVQMPSMDGWETLAAIRADPATAHLPVIMCTVKGLPEDRLRGWELGCDGYIGKPFDLDTMVDLVRAVAERSPEQREREREAALFEIRQALAR